MSGTVSLSELTLAFSDPRLERNYMRWCASGALVQDCLIYIGELLILSSVQCPNLVGRLACGSEYHHIRSFYGALVQDFPCQGSTSAKLRHCVANYYWIDFPFRLRIQDKSFFIHGLTSYMALALALFLPAYYQRPTVRQICMSGVTNGMLIGKLCNNICHPCIWH